MAPDQPDPTEAQPPGSALEDAADESEVEAMVLLADAQRRAVDAIRDVRRAYERVHTEHMALRQVIAHELSNPLAAVVGALDVLATRDVEPEVRRDLVGRARRQARQIAELIDDLLGLPVSPSLEAQRADLEEVRLGELVTDVVAAVGHRITPERLDVHVDDDVSLMTSAPRLRRVLVNLVTNAARYSPESRPVAIRARREGRDVHIEVLDEGAGVDPQVAEEIFAPFVSGAEPEAETEGAGLGLGLWVVRSLVVSLGGTVQLLAREPSGTKALVVLPQQRRDDPHGDPDRVIDLTAEDLRAIRSLPAAIR